MNDLAKANARIIELGTCVRRLTTTLEKLTARLGGSTTKAAAAPTAFDAIKAAQRVPRSAGL